MMMMKTKRLSTAQAVLGDVAGDELAARRPAAEDEQPDGEQRPPAPRRRSPSSVAWRIVTALLRRAMTTRSSTTIATNPSARQDPDGRRHGSEHEFLRGVADDDGFEGLFRPRSRTSSTGDADEALRDDDTAAKEYSPSSGRRVADDDRAAQSAPSGENPHPERRGNPARPPRVRPDGHLGWSIGRRRSHGRRSNVEGSIPRGSVVITRSHDLRCCRSPASSLRRERPPVLTDCQ